MNRMLRANLIGVSVYAGFVLGALAVLNGAFSTLPERSLIFSVLAFGGLLGLVWWLAVGWRRHGLPLTTS